LIRLPTLGVEENLFPAGHTPQLAFFCQPLLRLKHTLQLAALFVLPSIDDERFDIEDARFDIEDLPLGRWGLSKKPHFNHTLAKLEIRIQTCSWSVWRSRS
jgi:hypothetical protein